LRPSEEGRARRHLARWPQGADGARRRRLCQLLRQAQSRDTRPRRRHLARRPRAGPSPARPRQGQRGEALMYLKHFALLSYPFGGDIPPDEMYASAATDELKIRLGHLIEMSGIGL